MVACPRKVFTAIFLLFGCTLVTALLPVYSLAIDEILPDGRELCELSAMEDSVSHYLEIATQGGWPRIPGGPSLSEGVRDERIPLLKQRLVASGDLAKPNDEHDVFNAMLKETVPGSQTHRGTAVNSLASNQNERFPLPKHRLATKTDLSEPANEHHVFDEMLKEAVQRFQARHGLTANGIVGVETLRELNVTVSERIKQLAATIEYCKKLPPLEGNRYILINITDFTLNLVEDGKPVLNMPVIVGKTTNQTPEFNGLITNLIINPTWSVPYSIAAKELLPKLKKNPGYLNRSRMKVYRSNKRIDPSTINWASYSAKNFPVLLRQDSGPGNSLGRIKFMFTNPHDIYLHDTPTKKLFQKYPRAFSHGCIRVQAPVDLAAYLMQDTPMGSEEAIKSAISRGKTRSLTIPSPIPIYIVYLTAWVDSEGTVQFRPNIYNRKLFGEGDIVAKNNADAEKTDTAKTVQKAASEELTETSAAIPAVAQVQTPAKTPAAASGAAQVTAPTKAPVVAPVPALVKTPAKTLPAATADIQGKSSANTLEGSTAAAASPAAQKIKVIGNSDSKRYHLPGMKYYNAVEAYHRVEFDSEADAVKAGYQKAKR